MKLASFEAITKALNTAGVRYLVAGGMAVNAHGYVRLTQDVDLVIQLESRNVRSALDALGSLGYRPTAPVTPAAFAEPEQRARWIEEKRMLVLNLQSDPHRETPVDVFVSEPFDFDLEYEAALKGEVAPGLTVRFVSIPTLIAMKTLANRPRDVDDIQHLRWIEEEHKRGGKAN